MSRAGAGRVTAAWALLGVALLFSSAVFRLGRRGIETLQAGLGGFHTAALVVLVVLFVYGEGFRAIQKRYAPHLLGRVRDVAGHPNPVYHVLAPLYAMSLVGAPRGTLVRAWSGVAAIVCAVLLLRITPDPWRGIVDLAVALALAWGLGAILLRAGRRGLVAPPSAREAPDRNRSEASADVGS
jgi:hypothetical protein